MGSPSVMQKKKLKRGGGFEIRAQTKKEFAHERGVVHPSLMFWLDLCSVRWTGGDVEFGQNG